MITIRKTFHVIGQTDHQVLASHLKSPETLAGYRTFQPDPVYPGGLVPLLELLVEERFGRKNVYRVRVQPGCFEVDKICGSVPIGPEWTMLGEPAVFRAETPMLIQPNDHSDNLPLAIVLTILKKGSDEPLGFLRPTVRERAGEGWARVFSFGPGQAISTITDL